ncbi:44928_t:CDS:2 [Gigaspora margarita]|uniref:44928_t:CDS:1 n=1 Tax=Gigaspora margarita TaxID=4874 RepID=A0ABN7UEF3_GIGMA|nr:44928_t:CDS:2 [Gigaspora margarita]
MPSHVALLVAVTSKYFYPTNEQPQLCIPRDLVFISGKYVIEKLEQCITVLYASVVNNENPNHEFDVSDVPECILHCMISVMANCKPKEVEDYIYFGVESVKYNSVTSLSAVRMQMTVLYSSQDIRFQKYLGTSATDIDYLRTSALNYKTFKNSSLTPLKHAESSASSRKPGDVGAFEFTETLVDASVKTSSCSKEREKRESEDQ